MARYEADKIIQLLEYCSWMALTEMNFTGLHDLASRLDPEKGVEKSKKEQKVPNDKYLVDLLSDARTALKKDNFIVKRDSYINLLLKYGGFETWNEWLEILNSASEYIAEQSLDDINFDEQQFNIVISAVLERQLNPILQHVRKCSGFQLNLATYKEDSLAEQAQRLSTEIKEHSFIIWTLPLTWKNEVNTIQSPSWQELMKVGSIVPVWIDPNNTKDVIPPFIPGLKQSKVLGGITGVLTTLLFLREKLNEEKDPDSQSDSKEPATRKSSGNVQNFNNGSGIFLQGNIHSKHVALGDIHQTIHNHKNKNK